MNELNVAVVQMVSTEDIQSNTQQILSLLSQFNGSAPSLDMVCLPENSLYNKISNSSPGIQLDDPCLAELQSWVDQYEVAMNLGAIPLLKSGKVYNSTVLLTPAEPAQSLYDKIHLFDISMGSLVIKESAQFTAGNKPATKSFLGWNLGFTVCYDLRFSELFLHYHKSSTDIIFVPAAFTRRTGRAHWETLLRARAIETQCYIVAAAQTGEAKDGVHQRLSYGHSMVVDPWGKVLLDMSEEEPAIEVLTLDKSILMKTRQNMPLLEHRKL